MREKKFTEGPWIIANWDGDEWPEKRTSIASTDVGCICINPRYISSEEFQPNAHLIAAAPELLEALEDLIEYGQCDDIDEEWQSEELKRAIAAIKKAYGESP